MTTTLDPGKARGLQRVTSEDGFFLICALDHLSDLTDVLAPDPSTVTYADTVRAKLDLVKALSPSLSAFLLDPLYALGPVAITRALPRDVGMMSSIEFEDYQIPPGARKTRFWENWNVRKAKAIGADVGKLLWFYRPDAETAEHQRQVVRDLVAQCAEASLALVVEPIWYPLIGEDPTSAEWKARRVEGIIESAIEVNSLGVDMLKVEFPGSVDTEEGRAAAVDACQRLDAGVTVPWVLLSAGVGFSDFLTQVEISCAAGASGYLAGRSIWRDAVSTHDPSERDAALAESQRRLEELNAATRKHGRPYRPELSFDQAADAMPQGWYATWH